MWSTIHDLKMAFKTFDSTQLKENYHTDAVEVITWLRENLYHSKSTTETYRESIFRFYLWLSKYKNITISECKRNDVIEYMEFIQNIPLDWRGTFRSFDHEDWRPFSKVKLSKRTTNFSLQLIHQLFTYLHQIDYINKSPLALPVKKIKYAEVQQDKFFTIKECKAIFAHIVDLPEKSEQQQELKIRAIWLFKLLFYTGCRKSEILNSNMDCVIIKHEKLWLSIIGKGNKPGEIPIVPQLEEALDEYRNYYGLPPIRNKINTEQHIPLVIKCYHNNVYQTMSKSTINHQLKKICRGLADKTNNFEFCQKLYNVSAHWFRHTSATIQANSGVDLRTVQKNLRHSSIQTTLNYQHTDKIQQHVETSEKFQIYF